MNLDHFAAISDIHGNLTALDAVLHDIEQRGITSTVNLGDHLYGPLDPIGTAERLASVDMVNISGNCDRMLIEDAPAPKGSTVEWNRSLLSHSHLDWLRKQVCTSEQGDILLCHATPDYDDVYLLEQVNERGVFLTSSSELQRQLQNRNFSLLLCGHSHVPRTVMLSNRSLIVNPGSVGLAAYTEDRPRPHSMESGSPHARYAVLTRERESWRVEHVQIAYDWKKAAQLAQKNGRPDWAKWLATGRT